MKFISANIMGKPLIVLFNAVVRMNSWGTDGNKINEQLF